MSESYQFSNVLGFPILSVLLYIPLAAAVILIFFVNREKHNFIRWFANITAFVDMLATGLQDPGAMDPDDVGAQVVHAIRTNQFWLLPNGEPMLPILPTGSTCTPYRKQKP